MEAKKKCGDKVKKNPVTYTITFAVSRVNILVAFSNPLKDFWNQNNRIGRIFSSSPIVILSFSFSKLQDNFQSSGISSSQYTCILVDKRTLYLGGKWKEKQQTGAKNPYNMNLSVGIIISPKYALADSSFHAHWIIPVMTLPIKWLEKHFISNMSQLNIHTI